MFVIAGKSCSGKNAIARELIKRGYKQCITYTTRPIRKGETDGIDYHFISVERFQELIDEGFFAEYKVYETEFGKWYYGSAAHDFEDDDCKKFVILTPEGIRDVKSNTGLNPKVLYIFANLETIKKRLLKRGDNVDEAMRRIEKDMEDFRGFEMEADRIIYNHDGYDIKGVVDKIEMALSVVGNK